MYLDNCCLRVSRCYATRNPVGIQAPFVVAIKTAGCLTLSFSSPLKATRNLESSARIGSVRHAL